MKTQVKCRVCQVKLKPMSKHKP